jgi:hypothetical protein
MKESNILPRKKQKTFLLFKASRRHMELIDPPIQGIMGIPSRGLKRPLCETHRLQAPVPKIRMRGVTFVRPHTPLRRAA